MFFQNLREGKAFPSGRAGRLGRPLLRGDLSGARSGNDVPNVPALTANVGLQFQTPADAIGLFGDLTGRLTYQYVGSRAADVANTFDLNGYGLVNVRLGWQHDDVSVYAFANNLFDERYEVWGHAVGASAGIGGAAAGAHHIHHGP
ncbi:TonB-dependent receptor domain-containing protein [Maritimibacter sp. 55A14]|uniref:TonB-dependent receptor domain-containing protein n=1 Tax=Maritimibacter sp. 55A14 TaxID=2174844 RepID=UPI001304B89C|nr:TonB-dependent receptor [Maritimibacter sp. 55A14]